MVCNNWLDCKGCIHGRKADHFYINARTKGAGKYTFTFIVIAQAVADLVALPTRERAYGTCAVNSHKVSAIEIA